LGDPAEKPGGKEFEAKTAQSPEGSDERSEGSQQDFADSRMASRTHEQSCGLPKPGFELSDIGVTGDLGMPFLEEQPSDPLRP
jgi:hypothetical protein